MELLALVTAEAGPFHDQKGMSAGKDCDFAGVSVMGMEIDPGLIAKPCL